MWKWIERKAAATLIAVLVLAPMGAGAVTYEDSFEQCSYPKGFDLIVMRPLSMATIGIGGVLWATFTPLALLTTPRDVPAVYESFLGGPIRFTFKRELGECTGVDLSY